MPQLKDLTGTRFGELTVLRRGTDRIGKRGRHGPPVPLVRWTVKCHCGTVKDVDGANLRNGLTKTCGCKNKRVSRILGIETFVVRSFNQYVANAKKRGYSFDLTIYQFRSMIMERCHYCGSVPVLRQTTWYTKGKQVFAAIHGIDRKINELGYNLDNCVPCCTLCNRMKMTMTEKDFVAQARQIAAHRS